MVLIENFKSHEWLPACSNHVRWALVAIVILAGKGLTVVAKEHFRNDARVAAADGYPRGTAEKLPWVYNLQLVFDGANSCARAMGDPDAHMYSGIASIQLGKGFGMLASEC